MWPVFLDANILFSASYLENSGLRRLWELEDVALVTSSYAIQEARRNITATQQIADMTRLLSKVETVEITDEAPNLFREAHGLPDEDQPILWAAIDCGATHLITGDLQHFGKLMDTDIEGVRLSGQAILFGCAKLAVNPVPQTDPLPSGGNGT